MQLLLLQAMKCRVCRQLILDREGDFKVTLYLFGAVEYAVCPSCGNETTGDLMKDRNYRRRVRRFVAKRLAEDRQFRDAVRRELLRRLEHQMLLAGFEPSVSRLRV